VAANDARFVCGRARASAFRYRGCHVTDGFACPFCQVIRRVLGDGRHLIGQVAADLAEEGKLADGSSEAQEGEADEETPEVLGALKGEGAERGEKTYKANGREDQAGEHETWTKDLEESSSLLVLWVHVC